MKRQTSLLILASTVSTLALVSWVMWRGPATIPYQAWTADPGMLLPLQLAQNDRPPVRVRAEDLLHAEDFVFTMGVGDAGLVGPDVFRVDGSCAARYVFRTRDGAWWTAEFHLSPALLAQLRKLLVEIDYPSLKRRYYAGAADGNCWGIRVDVAGVTKKVFCDNHFPGAAIRLASFVGQEILPAHESDIRRAIRTRLRDGRNSWAWVAPW
jgi:hypothetical protein